MTEIFLKIFNMSMTAVLLIVAVILLRLLFRKAPKWITCLLWAIVAIRLLVPITLESPFSVLPTAEPVKTSIVTSSPYVESGVELIDSVANEIIGNPNSPKVRGDLSPAVPRSVNRVEITIMVFSFIWAAGLIGFAVYGLVSYIRLKKTVGASVRIGENVWMCDEIDSPFILGIIKPRIYLPSYLNGNIREYVLEHEHAHLARHDHWWKPLGFLLLAVHWFNPLCWVAYILFGRDVELACDEKAIRDMDKEDKVGYSRTLVALSTPGKLISACPVAFAEIGVKKRVKSVLSYKKPAFWLIATGVVCCAAVSGCFLTNPPAKDPTITNSDVLIRESKSSEASGVAKADVEVGGNDAAIRVSANENGDLNVVTNDAEKDMPLKVNISNDPVKADDSPVAFDIAFEGDIDGDGNKDRIMVEPYNESGAGGWSLELNGSPIYEGKIDMATDFDVWNTDIDNDGEKEIIVNSYPHTNVLPLVNYVVLKNTGSEWKPLQNTDEFGMKDSNGNTSNYFPVKVTLGEDKKTAVITIDGTDDKYTLDLEQNYKKLAKQEKDNFTGEFAEKFLAGKLEPGYAIGTVADWGLWDVKAAKLDGKNCLIARQGLCGADIGRFDMYGTLDIYFDYDDSGKINIIKTAFNKNK